MIKINAFFEEGIAVPDSNLNRKLDYLKFINKELNVLNDDFYHGFRSNSLLLILTKLMSTGMLKPYNVMAVISGTIQSVQTYHHIFTKHFKVTT
jgi:hypothetical protein